MSKKTNTLIIPGDSSGCAWYRMETPYMGLRSITKNHNFIESRKLILDEDFYKDVDHVRIQKWCNEGLRHFFEGFLKPLSDRYGFTITYDIDDVMLVDDLPLYNIGRESFTDTDCKDHMRAIMDGCHFVTVSTQTLKDYYVENLGLESSKFLVFPNYIPRWWSDTYNLHDITDKYNEDRKRRILIAGSTSHFSLDGEHEDDYSHICEFIRENVDKYTFVFIPHIPYQLLDLYTEGKIELRPGSDILNYNREVYNMSNVDAIIAPLKDNVFNRCKSYIKIKEAFCAGIPIFAQNLPTYSQYVDEYHLFDDASELDRKFEDLFSSEEYYLDIVTKCRHIADYGDEKNPNGFWLEKNMNSWARLFTMPKSTVKLNLKGVNYG